jgi:hypothetical protein
LTNKITAQINENVNPRGNYFFGAEVGLNTINSLTLNESNKSIQGGILAEYYFAKHWSLSGRIKYFKTGVSFHKPEYKSTSSSQGMGPNLSGLFDNDEYLGRFEGAVISFPLDIKWEFRIYKNLSGNLKLGYAYNIETKNDYVNYTNNVRTDYPTHYGSSNTGFGFNYFINKKSSIYIDFENYFGAEKGRVPSFLFDGTKYAINNQINIGIKYNLKSDNKIK